MLRWPSNYAELSILNAWNYGSEHFVFYKTRKLKGETFMSAKVTWLIVFVLLYWAYCIFWGVRGAQMAKTASDYFISGRKLPMWVFVLAATATSFSGWTFMGHPG